MAQKVAVNPQRGEFDVQLNGQTLILNAKFSNIARLENYIGLGAYPLAERIVTGDVRLGDAAAIIYCFYEGRDTEGYTYDEIGEAIMEDGLDNLVSIIQKFIQFAYRIDEMEDFSATMADESGDTDVASKKKKVA